MCMTYFFMEQNFGCFEESLHLFILKKFIIMIWWSYGFFFLYVKVNLDLHSVKKMVTFEIESFSLICESDQLGH